MLIDIRIDSEKFYHLYNSIYYIYFIILLFYIICQDIKKKRFSNQVNKFLSLNFILFFAVVVGLRDYSVGTDTQNYLWGWIFGISDKHSNELVFKFLIKILKMYELSYSDFLLLISLLFHILIYKGFSNLTKTFYANLFYCLFCVFSLFFILSMSINVIRQGLSLALLLYAYSLFINRKKSFLVYLVIAYFSHTTSIIPTIIFFMVYISNRYIQMKWYMVIYIISIIAAYLNLGILNFAPFMGDLLQDNSRIQYLDANNEIYKIGFKPQFVVFNSIMLLIALFARTKIVYTSLTVKLYLSYDNLIKYYILSSVIFFMVFQIPFSDRWGLFSWIAIPILIIPFFSKEYNLTRLRLIIILFLFWVFTFFQVIMNKSP